MIVTQILLVSTLGKVWGTVRRIPLLMLGCEGLRYLFVLDIMVREKIIEISTIS